MLGQQPRELLAREWTSLVRVKDRWGTILRDGFLHRIQAEIGGQRVGQPPRQYPVIRLVEHREESLGASEYR